MRQGVIKALPFFVSWFQTEKLTGMFEKVSWIAEFNYKSLLTAMRRSQGLRGERDYNDLAKGHGVLLPHPFSATR